ncbi:GspE/PulE family protein [Litoribacillus peritrichatus]|uniref:Bacterial type II secretion system protein E domain-containing protein n=1 Tax=Litoribacillus peritrichatus TaxID=718191 RepID=A0ABP7MRN8_9GAMM
MISDSSFWCSPPDGYGKDMDLEQPSVSYFRCDQKGGNATLLNIDIKEGTISLFEHGHKRTDYLSEYRAIVLSDPLLDVEEDLESDVRCYEFVFNDHEVFISRAVDVQEVEGVVHVFRVHDGNVYRVLVPKAKLEEYHEKISVKTVNEDRQQALDKLITSRAQLSDILKRGLLPTRNTILKQLHHNGCISDKELSSLLRELGEKHKEPEVIKYLLSTGFYKEKDIQMARAQCLGLPYVEADKIEPDKKAIALFDEATARELNIFPVMFFQDRVVVAMVNPADYSVMTQLRFRVGKDIEPVVTNSRAMMHAIDRLYSPLSSDAMFFQAEASVEVSVDFEQEVHDSNDGSDRPTVKLVSSILSDAINKKVSDIHIRPQEKHVDLIFRINGTLVPIKRFSKSMLSSIVSRIKIIGRMNVAEHRLPQDGRTHLMHAGKSVDLRTSILPSVYGESVVMRVLDTSAGMKGLDEIGFSETDKVKFAHLINRSAGMILVTGPTGSGKSTTLYAALQEVTKRNVNVITVEDPVEYHMNDVLQVQVQHKIGMNFAKVLRQMLRHDPDVIMVGEIRDQETALIAAESALTGHIVLSTLHTNSASLTISRLLEMGIEPYMINSSLAAVLAQRLVRTNCPHCTEEYVPDPEIRALLGVTDEHVFYKGKGCVDCMQSGVLGRKAVYELLQVGPEMRRLIVNDPNPTDIEEQARKDGMKPLTEHALALAKDGLISLEEAYRIRLE